jgi:hypothetical protein
LTPGSRVTAPDKANITQFTHAISKDLGITASSSLQPLRDRSIAAAMLSFHTNEDASKIQHLSLIRLLSV